MNENVFIHLQPTLEEVEQVYCELNEYGDCGLMPPEIRSYIGWMNYFFPRPGRAHAIAFCPLVIEVDGTCPAIIWMTDYCSESRSAQVHFAAHGRYRLKTVFGTARLALTLILRSKEVDLLQAFYAPENIRAAKMARAMGFREYARSGRCVYSFAMNGIKPESSDYGQNEEGAEI